MDRLGGLDTAFLYCETPGMHMHACGLVLLDPGPMRSDEVYERIRALLLGAMPNVPLMGKRPAAPPLGIGRPFWVDDVDFDLDHHLHRIHLRRPGDHRALADLVGQIASVPLHHDRPLWEVWLVEGLADGRLALLAKIHHAAIDGIAAIGIMGQLFDLEPESSSTRSRAVAWLAERRPGQLRMLGGALGDLLSAPFGLARLLPATALRVGSTAIRFRSGGRDRSKQAAPFRAPRASFNATVTASRSVAFRDVSMTDVKRVKEAYGVKVNDVLTAIVGGALRRYLAGRGELPDRSLIAAEPVSVHDRGVGLAGATRLSVMFSTLATDVADPVARLRTIAAANVRSKGVTDAVGADTLMHWSQYVWPLGYALGARLYAWLRLADRHPVVHNLLVSNVPGPPVALYLAGARATGIYPFGPIFDGAGLNVTAMSSGDHVGFGVIACPDLVPDVWQIADALPLALDELVESSARGVRRRAAAPKGPTSAARSSGH